MNAGDKPNEATNLISAEEKDSSDIGLSVYTRYLSQSPGCCCNLGLLLFAIAPFVVLGSLRLFVASWDSTPFSAQNQAEKEVQFTVIAVILIGILGFTAVLIEPICLHFSN